MNNMNTQQNTGFFGLGIAPRILEVLQKLGYVTPTPIQTKSIPTTVEGKDIVGIAQTGTGKTLAFGIPMIQRLASSTGKGLVLLPTRELAVQVEEELKKIGNPLGLRTAVLIGGAPMWPQKQALKRNPHIVIATPGRLYDHMEQRTLQLGAVSILVLDEADRMLDMGFLPQIKRIVEAVPKERQTMLFSATLSSDIMRIASSYMKLPIRIEVAPAGTTVEQVTQELFVVGKDDKQRLLEKILLQYKGSTLVFLRTKYGARRLARAIKAMGHTAAEMHSERSLSQRKEALEGFKVGKYRVLVATDIMARGIDVKGIELVVNFDLPMRAEDYVHRIGRTARAGQAGYAISFATPDQRKEVREIERFIRKPLSISPLSDLPPARFTEKAPSAPRPRFAGARQRSRPFSRYPRGRRAS